MENYQENQQQAQDPEKTQQELEEERLAKKDKQLEQRIRRDQLERRRIKQKREDLNRKKRNHAMILVGTTLMSHFSDDQKNRIVNGSDEEIKNFVNGLFQKKGGQ